VSWLRDGWHWLGDEPRQRMGIRLLEISIGAMLLFRVFTEARFASYLWGPRGIGWGSTVYMFGDTLGRLLDRAFATEAGTAGVLAALALAAFGLLSGYGGRIATALALVAFVLLETRLPEIPDGGDNITRLVLTYMLFLVPGRAKPARGSLGVWFHNVAVLAIAFQITILYSTSGMMKASGDRWHHGVAMYYISQVEWFSLPALREMFRNPLMVVLASYIPLFYQILFPLAMLSRVKLLWLALGIGFHLGVAVFMGLITFSTAMIGMELFLISDGEYASMLQRMRSLRDRLSALGRAKVASPTQEATTSMGDRG
jgi:hypothetical protein